MFTLSLSLSLNIYPVELLKSKGVASQHTNFPDRSTSIGSIINSYLTNAQELSDQVIHLLFSSNRWERVKSIRNDLLAGTTIICDRYAYSGVAYSVAKGLDFDWCCAPDRGLPRPDAVFYLRSKPEQLQARGGYGEERYVIVLQFSPNYSGWLISFSFLISAMKRSKCSAKWEKSSTDSAHRSQAIGTNAMRTHPKRNCMHKLQQLPRRYWRQGRHSRWPSSPGNARGFS